MSSYVRPDSLPRGNDSLDFDDGNDVLGYQPDEERFLPRSSTGQNTSAEVLFSLFVSLAGAIHTSIAVQRSNIVENIVNQDVGIINIHTKYVGSGSTFSVRALGDENPGMSLAIKSAMPLNNRLPEHQERHRLASVILELRALTFLSASSSPNVVRLLAVSWETDIFDRGRKWPVAVLELAEGGTLHEFLQAKSVDLFTKLRFCLNIATGLDALHRHGIIHGDLKPTNLLVFSDVSRAIEPEWIVKLTDFGGAVLDIQDGGSAMLRTPTPPWNAPEWTIELSAHGLLSTDVYSLGLVFFSIFCNGSDFFKLLLFSVDPKAVSLGRETQLEIIQNLKRNDTDFRSKLVDTAVKQTLLSDEDANKVEEMLSLTVRLEPEQRSLAGAMQSLQQLTGTMNEGHSPQNLGKITRRLKDTMAGPSELETLTPEVRQYVRRRLKHTALHGPDSELRRTAAMALSIDAVDEIDEPLNSKTCLTWLAHAAELEDKLAQSLMYRFYTAFKELMTEHLRQKAKDWLLQSALKGYFAAQEDYFQLATENEFESFQKVFRTIYGGIGWDRFGAKRTTLRNKPFLEWEATLLAWKSNPWAVEPSNTTQDTLLHFAASAGYLTVVEEWIHLRPNAINLTANHGETPLLLACRSGHIEVAHFLLKHGADPHISDENGDIPFHWIASFEENHMHEVAARLREGGADPNAHAQRWTVRRDPELSFEEGTPLHRAVQRGSMAAVKVLLEHGAGPSDPGGRTDQWTPMHLAAHLHYPEILKALLDKIPGPSPAGNVFGRSSLLIPAIKGQIERGRVFDKIARHGSDWWTRQKRCLDLLIQQGAKIHMHQMPQGSIGNGSTALFIAVGLSHPNAARYLLEHEACSDIEIPCALEEGHTPSRPLHRSITQWNKDCFKLLLQHDADARAKHTDENGREQTYLYECASSGHADSFMATELIAKGVQVDEAPSGYETPFACAVRKRCFTLASYLLQQGANPCVEFSAGLMFELEQPRSLLAILIMEQSLNTLACIDFLFEQLPGHKNLFLSACSSQELTVFHQIANIPEHGRDDTACGMITFRLLEYLRPTSEQINALAAHGYTALALAANTGNLAVAAPLLKHGADPLTGRSLLNSASALLQMRLQDLGGSGDPCSQEMLRLFKEKVGEDDWINFNPSH